MPYIGANIGNISVATYRKLSDISSGFTGLATTFQLSVPPGTVADYITPGSPNQLLISVGGVIQEPGVDFTVSGSQITFTTAPLPGLSFFGVQLADAINIGVPSDTTVTTAKLVDGAVTTAKIADLNVTTSKIVDQNVTTAKIADLNVTTGKLANNAVTTAKLDSTGIAPTVTSINGSQLAGNRNRIINGGMAIDQRNNGATQTFTVSGALAYSVDRWFAYCTGGSNVTGARVAGATAGQYRYQFTGAASSTLIVFAQRIEQANSADLAGTTVTLSADLANTLFTTTQVNWALYYANTADSFGTVASPTVTLISPGGTGVFNVTSTVARYSVQIPIPAAATTGLQVVFSVSGQTSGTWTIGDVQLEPGPVATPFERRSYGAELALCQRYYETGSAKMLTYQAAGAAFDYQRPFAVTKRATPVAIAFSGTTYNNASGINTNNVFVDSFNPYATATALGTCSYVTSFTASAEL